MDLTCTTNLWRSSVSTERIPLRLSDDMNRNNVATEEEQAMMLRLLELNSARLDPTYKPKRDRHEENFKLSFLLPVLPLDGAALARLEKADACRVCGDMKTSGMKRCSRCKGEDAYCSASKQSHLLLMRSPAHYCRSMPKSRLSKSQSILPSYRLFWVFRIHLAQTAQRSSAVQPFLDRPRFHKRTESSGQWQRARH